MGNQENRQYPTFYEAFQVWIKVALYSFGGPAGQIAVMHKYLVEDKRWISENRFLHALNYCMLLPGPEAQQLATYIGWLLHKTRGGVIAGALFVLPGFLSILILSIIYALWKDLTFVQGIFYGIKPAVLAIVAGAVLKIGKRALKNEIMVGIAVLAFIAIFFFKIDFPVIILAAGLTGYIGGTIREKKFLVIEGPADKKSSEAGLTDQFVMAEKPSISKTLGTALLWLTLWLVPVGLLVAFLGADHIFSKESIFFSKAAVFTFGGAYAVLAYISQKAVEAYGWLQAGEMLDGLGMAETTPGPLIQVVQFVAFMGAFRNAGTLDPLLAGVLASVLITWVTFLPSFLFIFTGAPYIEYLRGNKSLTTALSGITAAVVGVILNLGVWLSLHTLFHTVNEVRIVDALHLPFPALEIVDYGALFITIVALVLNFILKWDMLRIIVACVFLGLIIRFFVH